MHPIYLIGALLDEYLYWRWSGEPRSGAFRRTHSRSLSHVAPATTLRRTNSMSLPQKQSRKTLRVRQRSSWNIRTTHYTWHGFMHYVLEKSYVMVYRNKISVTARLIRSWIQEQTRDGKNTSTPPIVKAGRQLKHFQLYTQHTCHQHRPFQRRFTSFIRLTVAGCPTWCAVGERWQREAGSTSKNIKADLLHIYPTWQPGNLNWRLSQDPLLASQSVKGLHICSYQLANLSEPAW